MRIVAGLVTSLGAVALGGCVALPAIAPAAAAGGQLVRTGTEHVGGATYRTFSVPLNDLYRATRKTLDELGFAEPEEEAVEERVTVRARGIDRTVRIDLHPITGALTQMRVSARKESLGKDAATASELVEQTERVLAATAHRRHGWTKSGDRRSTAR
jgi:hypothetical protein